MKRLFDLDGDGEVTAADEARIASFSASYPVTVGDPGFDPDADVNQDGVINRNDEAAAHNKIGHSHSAPNTVSLIGNIAGYNGYLFDEAVGMHHVRYRWYSPETGRWVARDPAGYQSGMSLYAYVSGLPLFYVDPSGLKDYMLGWSDPAVQFDAGAGVNSATRRQHRGMALRAIPRHPHLCHRIGCPGTSAEGGVPGVNSATRRQHRGMALRAIPRRPHLCHRIGREQRNSQTTSRHGPSGHTTAPFLCVTELGAGREQPAARRVEHGLACGKTMARGISASGAAS